LASREKKKLVTYKEEPVEDFEDAEEVDDDEGGDGEEEEDVWVNPRL